MLARHRPVTGNGPEKTLAAFSLWSGRRFNSPQIIASYEAQAQWSACLRSQELLPLRGKIYSS